MSAPHPTTRVRTRTLSNSLVDSKTVYYLNGSQNTIDSAKLPGVWAEEYTQDVVGNYGGNNPFINSRPSKSEASSTLTMVRANNPNEKYVVSGCVTQMQLRVSRPYCTTPTQLSSDLLGMTELAKAECLAKIDSTPYQMGEDIGEIANTLRFLEKQADLVDDLNGHFKQVLRGNYSLLKSPGVRRLLQHTKSGLDSQARAHLVLSFGYGQLVRSISNAMEAYDERDRALPVQRKATSRKTNKASKYEVIRRGWSNSPDAADYFTRFASLYDDVKATVLYHQHDPASDFRFKLGLRGKDLLPTAWALVPASWFVDSFYNISDSIKAVENILDPSIVIDRAWITTETNSMDVYQYTHSVNSGWNYTGSGAPYESLTHYKERRPWKPTVYDAFPSRVKVPTNVYSIMNDAAYSWLQVSKRIPRIIL